MRLSRSRRFYQIKLKISNWTCSPQCFWLERRPPGYSSPGSDTKMFRWGCSGFFQNILLVFLLLIVCKLIPVLFLFRTSEFTVKVVRLCSLDLLVLLKLESSNKCSVQFSCSWASRQGETQYLFLICSWLTIISLIISTLSVLYNRRFTTPVLKDWPQ